MGAACTRGAAAAPPDRASVTRSTLCLNLTACALIRSKSSDSFRTSSRQSPGGGHAAFRTEEGAAGSGKVDESSAEATVASAAAAAAADGDDADDDDDADGDEDAVGVAVVVAAESPPPLSVIAVGSIVGTLCKLNEHK